MMLGIERNHFQERLLYLGPEAEPRPTVMMKLSMTTVSKALPWEMPRTKDNRVSIAASALRFGLLCSIMLNSVPEGVGL